MIFIILHVQVKGKMVKNNIGFNDLLPHTQPSLSLIERLGLLSFGAFSSFGALSSLEASFEALASFEGPFYPQSLSR